MQGIVDEERQRDHLQHPLASFGNDYGAPSRKVRLSRVKGIH